VTGHATIGGLDLDLDLAWPACLVGAFADIHTDAGLEADACLGREAGADIGLTAG